MPWEGPGKAGISGLHCRLPRGVRPRLEGKPRTPLSSRVATRVSWNPLSGLKGVQPPLQFGERTRDCSPGHAGGKVKVKSLSQVRPSATPWTAAFQAPPFMGFSRQEYWSGVPLYPGGGHGNPLQYLAWKIPWTEEPGGLHSIGSQRVGHT